MRSILIFLLLFVAQAPEILSFDIGDGEIAEGWIGVPSDLLYNQTIGYGWTHQLRSAIRDNPDVVFNDIVWAGELNTFIIDVPIGNYNVTVYYGDIYPHSVVIEAEGTRVPVLDNEAGEFTSYTFTVPVMDAQLEITFDDDERAYHWAISGITVEFLSEIPENVTISEIETELETELVTELETVTTTTMTTIVTTVHDITETTIFGVDARVLLTIFGVCSIGLVAALYGTIRGKKG